MTDSRLDIGDSSDQLEPPPPDYGAENPEDRDSGCGVSVRDQVSLSSNSKESREDTEAGGERALPPSSSNEQGKQRLLCSVLGILCLLMLVILAAVLTPRIVLYNASTQRNGSSTTSTTIRGFKWTSKSTSVVVNTSAATPPLTHSGLSFTATVSTSQANTSSSSTTGTDTSTAKSTDMTTESSQYRTTARSSTTNSSSSTTSTTSSKSSATATWSTTTTTTTTPTTETASGISSSMSSSIGGSTNTLTTTATLLSKASSALNTSKTQAATTTHLSLKSATTTTRTAVSSNATSSVPTSVGASTSSTANSSTSLPTSSPAPSFSSSTAASSLSTRRTKATAATNGTTTAVDPTTSNTTKRASAYGTTASTTATTTIISTTSTSVTSTIRPSCSTAHGTCVTCHDLLHACNKKENGVYDLRLGTDIVKAYCDMEGGGYTLVHGIHNDSVNFNRSWDEYERGFGEVGASGNFWLGLRALHLLTEQCGQSSARIELGTNCSSSGLQSAHVHFGEFKVGNASVHYVLTMGGTSGPAGGGCYNFTDCGMSGRPFSTFDAHHTSSNCASAYAGGWWYTEKSEGCACSKLTGRWSRSCRQERRSLYWATWPESQGSSLSPPLQMAVIKVRPPTETP